jgi:hypothetical protein
MEFLKNIAESLNRCNEKLKLEQLEIAVNDNPINKIGPPRRPVEYIKIMGEERTFGIFRVGCFQSIGGRR